MERNQRSSATLRPDRRTFLRAMGVAGIGALAGCTESGPEDENEDGSGGELSSGAQNLIWATSVTSETYENLSRELAAILEEAGEYTVEVEGIDEGAGEEPDVEIARGFGAEGFDFGLIRNDVAHFAYNGFGLEEFENEPVENLRGVATLYPEAIHVLARADAGIESLEDLAGATIDTGASGSATRVNALRILESAGVSSDEFTERNDGVAGAGRLSGGASRSAGRSIGFAQTDGGSLDAVDAAFIIGDWPVEAVEEAVEGGDFELLNLDDETREEIRTENEWLTEVAVPAGTYDGVEGAIETVSVRAMIATREGVDEEVVGDVTTTIFENVDRIETKREFISSETAMEGMSIETDPAAERSLEEVEADEADEGDGQDEDGDPDEETQEPDDETDGTEEGAEEPEDAEDDGDAETDETEENGTSPDAEDVEDGGDTDGTDAGEPGAGADDGADGDDGDADGSTGDEDASGDAEEAEDDGADTGDSETADAGAAATGESEDAGTADATEDAGDADGES